MTSGNARKKVVFVVVEGPTDDEALGIMLEKIFDRFEVHVEIMHCDITTENVACENRVVNRMQKILRGYVQRNHYTLKDIDRVVHIIDTDGSFVPDSCIEEEPDLKKVRYSDSRIWARSREAIIVRNARKSANVRVLAGLETILGNVPYSIYYMSSNLDHVLYDKQNSTNDEKGKNAYRFAQKYRNSISEFLNFMTLSDFSVMLPYDESWEYIYEGTNSLCRHTNLGICFSEYYEKLIEEG
jgi:hypothetical protein